MLLIVSYIRDSGLQSNWEFSLLRYLTATSTGRTASSNHCRHRCLCLQSPPPHPISVFLMPPLIASPVLTSLLGIATASSSLSYSQNGLSGSSKSGTNSGTGLTSSLGSASISAATTVSVVSSALSQKTDDITPRERIYLTAFITGATTSS
jgi:hypothetical protein